MQAPPTPVQSPTPQSPQFSAELPTQWQGANNTNAVANTQFRHELPSSKSQNNLSEAFNPPTWAPFSIVTDNDSLSSGFPYTSKLRDLRVAPDQWLQFTTEVINAAKLTFQEDAAAWTTGVTTGTLSSPFLLVFAPWVGYYAGRSIHRKTLTKKVKERLASEGPLRNTLRSWNEGVFMERGIQLWLEPPSENGEVIIDVPDTATQKEIQKAAKKQGRRFRFVVMPYDPRNPVIGTNHSPVSPLQSQANWNGSSTSTTQSPISPEMGKWSSQSQNASPVEVSAVRPVGELPAVPGQKKNFNPFCSNTYELDGSSPEVAKKEG